MVTTQKRIQRRALKLALAGFTLTSFGVAAAAAPFWTPRDMLSAATRVESAHLTPLAAGPAIQLASAGEGANEDCVRVTKMTGPDGKVYPTRGIVCSDH